MWRACVSVSPSLSLSLFNIEFKCCSLLSSLVPHTFATTISCGGTFPFLFFGYMGFKRRKEGKTTNADLVGGGEGMKKVLRNNCSMHLQQQVQQMQVCLLLKYGMMGENCTEKKRLRLKILNYKKVLFKFFFSQKSFLEIESFIHFVWWGRDLVTLSYAFLVADVIA